MNRILNEHTSLQTESEDVAIVNKLNNTDLPISLPVRFPTTLTVTGNSLHALHITALCNKNK